MQCGNKEPRGLGFEWKEKSVASGKAKVVVKWQLSSGVTIVSIEED